MQDGNILILRGSEIAALLTGRDLEIVEAVRLAYEAHAAGYSSLPHSVFLTFPDEPKNRIIALPAYLGGEFGVAGVKWVSSFPGNLAMGVDRASAVVVLNSMATGRPEAFLEGSLISAKRTAASAALAARTLRNDAEPAPLGILGCGLINYEVVRFLSAVCPPIESIVAYDLDAARVDHFKSKCEQLLKGVEVRAAQQVEEVFAESSLISIATTAATPHISDLSRCRPGSTILHVSLRDLSPEVILSCDNIVDDVDHVCRAQTSVHLAEQRVGNRDFVRCSLGEILTARASKRKDAESIAVFSPFGLGILDLAVAKMVRGLALAEGRGTVIESFLPDSWTEPK